MFNLRAPSRTVPPFNLSEREIWPGCHEIVIVGELDLAVVDRLEDALDRAAERRVHALLDLGACSFLDAGCLGTLVRGHETLRDRRCQLLLYGVQGQVRRLLAVTGVAENGLLVSSGDAMPASRPSGAEMPFLADGDGVRRLHERAVA
jgi:anti-anti-sigma factor